LPGFPVDSSYLKAVRRRVSLARQLHSLEHKRNKIVRAEQWISKSAKAMDIEVDDDLYPK
jgi:ATP-dependent RNA helicase DDX24/MAK5